MAKSHALVAAEQRIAALEARLAVADEVCSNQRTRIAVLEARLAAAGPVVQRFGQRTVKRFPATQGAQS